MDHFPTPRYAYSGGCERLDLHQRSSAYETDEITSSPRRDDPTRGHRRDKNAQYMLLAYYASALHRAYWAREAPNLGVEPNDNVLITTSSWRCNRLQRCGGAVSNSPFSLVQGDVLTVKLPPHTSFLTRRCCISALTLTRLLFNPC